MKKDNIPFLSDKEKKEFLKSLKVKTNGLNDFFKKNLKKLLLEESKTEGFLEIINYILFKSSGQRLRPKIAFAVADLLDGPNEDILYPFISSIELIHNYSLVHDDLPALDNSDYRRGIKSVHKEFDESSAILAGNTLFNLSLEWALDKSNLPSALSLKIIRKILKNTGLNGMILGQYYDLKFPQPKNNQVFRNLDEEIDFIYTYKTGKLIELSFTLPALVLEKDQKVLFSLEKTGRLFGFLYQILNDLKDYEKKKTLDKKKEMELNYIKIFGITKSIEKIKELLKQIKQELVSFKKSQRLIFFLENYINNQFEKKYPNIDF